MSGLRSDSSATVAASSDHARKVLDATRRLHEALQDGAASHGALDLLLFLAAEDQGEGVTTSRCCNAVNAPRTSALRWISALVTVGLIDQVEDARDRRITLLRLTPKAHQAIMDWLAAISTRF